MGYDDAKSFGGRAYSGMSIGGEHSWLYPDGQWRERKVAPDRWDFSFRSTKRRRRAAPEGSGAQPGTMFHWYVMAHQRVRKVDQDTYATFMEGTKWKVGHRRPHWRRWSSEYDEQVAARDKLIRVLEETLDRLKAEAAAGAPPIEGALDPAVYRQSVPEVAPPEQFHLDAFHGNDLYAED